MMLRSRTTGIYLGGPTPSPQSRPHRLRSAACTAALMLATGLGAATWSGHHALEQAQLPLRATVQDEAAPIGTRRAALSAMRRDAAKTVDAVRELAERDHGALGDDARIYLEQLRAEISR